MSYLPITKEEMAAYGWDCPDIIIVSGDAYVDHPSFGTAIISRVLQMRVFRFALYLSPKLMPII